MLLRGNCGWRKICVLKRHVRGKRANCKAEAMSEEFALDNVGNFDEIEAFPPEFDDSFEEKKQEQQTPNYENVNDNQFPAEVQNETESANPTANFEVEQENEYPREALV